MDAPDRSHVYIEGFLDGQVTAYCEQVRLGSRLAGAVNCDHTHVERLRRLIAQEQCRDRVVPTECGRVCLWIYRYDFLGEIISRLDVLSDQDSPGVFGMWAMGKLLGYADCEISAYVARSGNEKPT